MMCSEPRKSSSASGRNSPCVSEITPMTMTPQFRRASVVRLQPGFNTRAWVHVVTQRVADEVEREYGKHDRHSWEEHQVRRVEEMSAAVIQHGAPACRGWRNSQPKKTHSCFRQHRASHADGSLHDHWLDDVGYDVTCDDAPVACTQSARGFYKFFFFHRQHLGANEARVAHPASDAERKNQVENAGTQERHKSDGQQNTRERKEGIHQDHAKEFISQATIVSGD